MEMDGESDMSFHMLLSSFLSIERWKRGWSTEKRLSRHYCMKIWKILAYWKSCEIGDIFLKTCFLSVITLRLNHTKKTHTGAVS